MALLRSIFCAACVVFLSSCVSLTPYLDSQFGVTVSALQQQQILDPAASTRNTEGPIADARAAREAINTYNASYRAPERPQNVFMVGVGK